MSEYLALQRITRVDGHPDMRSAPGRAYYIRKFGLTGASFNKKNVSPEQLAACADDSSRRLLLGIGEQFRKPVAQARANERAA